MKTTQAPEIKLTAFVKMQGWEDGGRGEGGVRGKKKEKGKKRKREN